MGLLNKFSNKIVLVYIIATFLPIIIISIYGLNIIEDKIFKYEMEDVREEMIFLSTSIENALIVEKGLLIHISHIVPSVNPVSADKNISLEDVQIDFLEFIATHPTFSSIVYIDDTGKEIVNVYRVDDKLLLTKDEELRDVSDKQYFLETIKIGKGNMYVSGLKCYSLTGGLCIDYGYSIFDAEGNKGVVLATLDARKIIDMIIAKTISDKQKLVHIFSSPMDFFIVNEKGDYFYDTDGFGMNNINNLQEAFPDSFPEILAMESGGLITDNYLLGFDKIDFGSDEKYTLIGQIDYKYAAAPVIYLRNTIYSVLIIIFILSILISVILARRFTRPIKSLIKTARKVSEGKLKTRVNINTGDELEEFAKVFNDMINSIYEREGELAEKTHALKKSRDIIKRSKDRLERNIKELMMSRTAMINILEDINVANEELMSLDKAKDEFLSIVSHELKTPLTPIKAYIEMLIDQDLGKLSPKQVDGLTVINRNVGRLKLLIDDLLEITRLETGKMKLNLEKVDMKDLVRNVVKERKLTAAAKSLKLSYSAKKMPKVKMDLNRITQVITNLLDNSIKFTPAGGSIIISAIRDNSNILVSVKDSGIGIDNKSLPHIFEKFYQVDSSLSRKFGGTGLGLSICKGIVEAHKGKIWVESVPNKGTTVTFSLPIKHNK